MKSIKTKIIVFFSAIIFFVCGVLGVTSYFSASSSIKKTTEKDLAIIAQQTSKLVSARLQKQLETLEIIANKTIVSNPNITNEEKLQLLEEVAKQNGYTLMDIADLNGNAISTNGKTYDLKDRDYFKNAKEGKDAISDLIVSKEDGATIICYAVPIKYNSNIIGVLVAARDGMELSKLIQDVVICKTGYAYIINEAGVFIGHKDTSLVKEKYNLLEAAKKDKEYLKLADLTEKMIKKESGSSEYFFKGQNKIMGYTSIEGINWSMAVTAPSSEILMELSTLKILMLIVSALMIIIGLALVFILAKQISYPIILATEHAKLISEGDLTRDVPEAFLAKKDEIGQLAYAFEGITKNFRNLIGNIIRSSNQVAESTEKFTITIGQVASSSEQIAKTIEEIAIGASEQAKNTEEGALKVSELGDYIESNDKCMDS